VVAKRIGTDHLEIASYVSDEVVAPGSLFSIVFDVKPNAGIHVYAPGAKDYRIINFRMDVREGLQILGPQPDIVGPDFRKVAQAIVTAERG
jgi:hypothetical protein